MTAELKRNKLVEQLGHEHDHFVRNLHHANADTQATLHRLPKGPKRDNETIFSHPKDRP